MNWIREHIRTPKDADYARRVLDRYRLGIKAKGAIRGVQIIPGSDACPVCQPLANTVYAPDQAPIIPLAECPLPEGCCCAYTPVMNYQE